MEMKKNQILKNSGNAFLNFSSPDEITGSKDFDTAYIDYEVHQVPKKVGSGEYDYIMETVVIEHKKDIDEFIQSQAGDVGVYAYIDRAARGLVDIEQATLSDTVVDMSNAPTTLMEAAALGERAVENFAKLPKDLTNGMSTEEFLSKVSAEDIINYFAKKATSDNVEVKEDK